MTESPVSPSDLAAALASSDPPLVVDVMSPASFACEAVPGAVNACIYEVAFADRMNELTDGDHGRSIVVYGLNDRLGAAPRALEVLDRLGFTNARPLAGGLEAWKQEGRPTRGPEADAGDPDSVDSIARIPDGRRQINLAKSTVEWTGRNVGGRHHGTVDLSAGWLDFRDGLPATGEFAIDLRTIRCSDIADDALNRLLVQHLESDDFFDVARHPEARFVLDRSEAINARIPGLPNLRLEGSLHLRGVTAPLAIDAAAGLAYDGSVVAQACVDLDRTVWGVRYGSSRFFERLGSHLVSDIVSLQLRIALA